MTEVEAQEVVQEVMIAAAKKMPGFTYEPGKDSLKGWLLSVTRWKVADQFRKREKAVPGTVKPGSRRGDEADGSVASAGPPHHFGGYAAEVPGERGLPNDDTARTSTVERVPDPASLALDVIWDEEWRENLLRAALERVRQTVNPAHYEMYHLHVLQGLTPRETARALGVSAAGVYRAKHRVGQLIRAEVKRLEMLAR